MMSIGLRKERLDRWWWNEFPLRVGPILPLVIDGLAVAHGAVHRRVWAPRLFPLQASSASPNHFRLERGILMRSTTTHCPEGVCAWQPKWLRSAGGGSGSSHDKEQREREGWRDDGVERWRDGVREEEAQRELERDRERERGGSERKRERVRERR